MPVLEGLDASHLRSAAKAYRDVLRSHQQRLNRLNVYPVPDGDTGTNMALTLESVVAALDDTADMASTCKAISHGSLMGARGNSGVILSQVLRGFTARLQDGDHVDGAAVAEALARASEAAYGAVMKPVEGTILTVVREAAGAAMERRDGSVVEVLEAAAGVARDALARTPDLLPVLAQAGVVDAGGAGFVLLLDALLHVADGRPLPVPEGDPGPVTATSDGADHGSGDLRYEVMFFLEAPDDAIPGFKESWAGLGDSIVVVGGDGLWNCHIHTDDIGGAIEAGIDAGRPRQIRVTDLAEQVEEEAWVRQGEAEPQPPAAVTAVVAVGAGDGVERILRSLGAHEVVAGGPSMNPSTAQILEAADRTGAEAVVVLPNDRNVVAVARQASDVRQGRLGVVPTTTVPEGFSALIAYDPDADMATNLEAMSEAAQRVRSGEVTRAVRDAPSPVGPIREGDYLGVIGGEVVVVARSLGDAACGLLEHLTDADQEVLTVIEGTSATTDATRRIEEWVKTQHPDVTVEVHRGDQPLAAYMFGAE